MVNERPPRQLRRQAPTRRSRHRYSSTKRRRVDWRSRTVLAAVALIVGVLTWAVLARAYAPTSNTSRGRFDAIIVLGTPADADGNPPPELLARVTEGVKEYERGVASRLILTGGPAHNRFVEAQVMARSATAQGIPESAIFVEPEAHDTIQNACFSMHIMKAHGWHSAEVVSAAGHLPRAGLIFSHQSLEWRTHSAPPLQPESAAYTSAASVIETLKTVRYLTFANWAERCEP